jgi:multiple sugar transport system permease protein
MAIALYPLIYILRLSFTDYRLINPSYEFIGLLNYISLFKDPVFLNALKVTSVYVGGVVTIEMVAGLGIALLLNMKIPGRKFFRVILLVPLLIPPVITALMWKLVMEAGSRGPLNYLLMYIGLPANKWLAGDRTALFSVMLIDIYIFTSFVVLILLAGLQSIPKELYEAASIDGANGWDVIKFITFPMLRPTFLLVLLFRLVYSITSFDIIFATTRGGPGISTTTVTFQTFLQGYSWSFMGYAAAHGVFLFVIVAVICSLTLSRTELIFQE